MLTNNNKMLVGGVLKNYQDIERQFDGLNSFFDPYKLLLMTPTQLNRLDKNLINIKVSIHNLEKILKEVGY